MQPFHIAKAMVFPVVMYGCESWTVKKAECQRIDALIFLLSKGLSRIFSSTTVGKHQFSSQVALVVSNLPANAGDTRDMGSVPESRRSLGVGNGNPLQYSCLENPMERGTWPATVNGVAKSQAIYALTVLRNSRI